MPRIVTFTGSEAHTSYGAKGHVFVLDRESGQEVPLFKSPLVTLVDQHWYEVQNGRWVQSVYEVPTGTILKLFAVGTYKGHPNDGDGVYLRVERDAAIVSFEGGAYQWRAGRVTGPVMKLSEEEMQAAGIVIEAKQKQYYREGSVAVREPSEDDMKGTVSLDMTGRS